MLTPSTETRLRPESGDSPDSRPLHICTLGRFAVTVKGQPLSAKAYGQRKPLAVLKALVAAGPAGIPVERLVDILWPDLDGDRARQAFAVALHRLRRMVGPERLPLHDATLLLAAEGCWVDAWAFAEMESAPAALPAPAQHPATANARGERLLALYRGPFLDGDFSVPEILTLRERLHEEFIRSVRQIGKSMQQLGQDASDFYQRAFAIDGLSEDLCADLMECLSAKGRAAEAIRAYRLHEDLLRVAANTAPSAALKQRYDALRQDEALPPSVIGMPEHSQERGPAAGVAEAELAPRSPWAGVPNIPALTGLPPSTAWLRKIIRPRFTDPVAQLERDGFPRYRRAALAVLPFKPIGGSAAETRVAEEMAGRLTTALSKFPDLGVASDTSVLALPSTAMPVRKIAKQLAIGHLVEGTVQPRGAGVEVSAGIIDARSGTRVWAQSCPVEDARSPGALDRVVVRFSKGIAAHLAYGLITMLAPDAYADDPESWELAVDAYFANRRQTAVGARVTLSILDQLRQRRPLDHRAIAAAADIHLNMARYNWTAERDEAMATARKLATEANDCDPQHVEGSRILAFCDTYAGEFDRAIGEIMAYLNVRNWMPFGHRTKAEVFLFAGRTEESLTAIRETARMIPSYPVHILSVLELGYFVSRNYPMTVASCRVALSRDDQHPRSWAYMAAAQALMGQPRQARATAETLMNLRPKTRASEFAEYTFTPFQYRDQQASLEQGLRMAGVPA